MLIQLGDRRIKTVLQALEADVPPGVSALAGLVNLSPSRLEHLFKQETGLPLRDYVFQCRLGRAAELLASSDEPVKSVAFAVGYRHASSFIRAFLVRFSENPTAYRKRIHENANYIAVHANPI